MKTRFDRFNRPFRLAEAELVTFEPTGFPNLTDSTLSWDNGTRTLTVAPVSASFVYYIRGADYTVTTSKTKQITDTEGLWFFYFDDTLTLQATQSFTTAILNANGYVAAIYWNATDNVAIYFGEERHGLTMDWATHSYLHNCNGLRYQSGFDISGYTLDTATDAAVSFGISNGYVWDEDLKHTIIQAASPANAFEQILTDPGQFPVYHKTGANLWRKDAATDFPFKNTASGNVNFNEFTGGVWQQTALTDGNFVTYWVFASNDRVEPIKVIQGERQDTSLANADTNNSYSSLTLTGLPKEEFKVLYRIVIQTSSIFGGTRKAKIIQIDDFRSTNNLSIVGGGGGGVIDHALLNNLTYENSGHTGFQPTLTASVHGTLINAATEKNQPVDADMIGLMDSAASNVLKKLSWANIKATLKAYFDTLYAPIGGGAAQYIHVRDEKPTTTNGGTSVTGINTRVLNTVVSNSISGASLATDQVTLPAGTYRFYGSAPQFGGYKHQALIYNVTDATYAIVGEHGYNELYTSMRSHAAGKIVISATKVFEFRHWIEYGRTNGLGLGNTSSGYINVFASLEIFKEA